ncbi:MAG: hypothetical protein ACRD2B_01865 [Terriglobia bacterium]
MADEKLRRIPAGGQVRTRRSGRGQPQGRCKDVNDLDEPQKEVVEKMLTEGATFEDTLEVVNDMGEKPLALRALTNYFRSNVHLQQARIRHTLRTADELKKALIDPESGKAELAEAVLITGLMGMNKGEVRAQFQNAFRVKNQAENNRLKGEIFRLKSEKLEIDRRFLEVRLKTEIAKRDLLTSRLEQLKEAVEHAGQSDRLGPEVIKQIQEIYGLVSTREPDAGGEAIANDKG